MDILGNIAIVKNVGQLENILIHHKKVKSVYLLHGLKEEIRNPSLELIYGEDIEEVIHVESGYKLLIPFKKAYFNPRFLNERVAFRDFVSENQTILDVTGGVGGFQIALLKEKKVKSVYNDINPACKEYFLKNLKLNKLPVVESHCFDILDLDLKQKFDVVLHNAPHEIEFHWQKLKSFVLPNGYIWAYFFYKRGIEFNEEYFKKVANISSSLNYWRMTIPQELINNFSWKYFLETQMN